MANRDRTQDTEPLLFFTPWVKEGPARKMTEVTVLCYCYILGTEMRATSPFKVNAIGGYHWKTGALFSPVHRINYL